jgi:squalene-associated FAD-dependent desaturase
MLSSYSISDDTETSVEALLLRFKQPEKLIKALWEPLCIATLNTPIKIASANIFVTVLKKSLLGKRSDSDFLFTKKCLGAILPDPAVTYLKQHNAEVKLSSRITKIIIKNNCVEGLIINDNLIATKNLILAIPPYTCAKLLIEHERLKSLSEKLSQFEYQPICTVYLQYPENITLNQSMIGIWGTTIQWLFDRKLADQKGLMAAIISADGPHMEITNELLIKQVQLEIAQLFPDWPAASYSKVIREKRATFNCSVHIAKLRPDNKTAIKGLFLCGDYTQTDLPATIEGAVISGKLAASQIIQNNLN